jgi:hypothetical protein
MIMVDEETKGPFRMRQAPAPVEVPKPPQAGERIPERQKSRLAGIVPSRSGETVRVGVDAAKGEKVRAAERIVRITFDDLSAHLFSSGDQTAVSVFRGAELNRLVGPDSKAGDLFKDSKVRYAYDKEQRIYSVLVRLDDVPRVLTVRAGQDFTELSLSDTKGNVLEMLRQQDGGGVTFYR